MAVSTHPGAGHDRLGRLALASLGFLLGAIVVVVSYEVFGGSSSSTMQGSGVAATQARDVAPFEAVELSGSNNVAIRVGGEQSVVVRADDNLIDRVTTEVDEGTLVIGNTPGSFSTESPMSVDVTVPSLSALKLSGSGNIVVDGVDAKSLAVDLPGSGTLTGSGTATQLEVSVGGSGVVRLTDLVATHARAAVGGSGSIFLVATDSLDASVSGSGAIVYLGSPTTVTKNVTGSGAITGG
jgi:Putative auto-transporter adhesin, head GIN domain